MGNTGIDETVLKILRKYWVRVWNGFMWLR